MIGYQKVIFSILLCMFMLVLFNSPVQAQEVEEKYTVYFIATMNSNPFPLQAHLINNNQIIPAEEWWTPRRSGGPVGLAVDDDNSRLYVSYEFSGVIDVFNARTLVPVAPTQITLPGASNVAGLVVSELRGRLYAVDRYGSHLYVYDSSTFARVTAEEFTLTGSSAFGIDVWGNTIYVTSGNNTIRYYNLDTQTLISSFSISDVGAMAIAVDGSDPSNVLVFTTRTYQYPFDGRLTKYNVNTTAESWIQLGADGRGVSVHPTLGLVYVGCSEAISGGLTSLRVYDQATLTLQDSETMGTTSWSSTDVVASRIQFGGSVSKTCTSHPSGDVNVGDTVVFDIDITNNSTAALDVIPLTDTYDTTYLQFLSATITPDDTVDDGQIDWSDLTATEGNLAVDGTITVTVSFRALATTPTSTNNVAQTHDVLDEFASPIPDAAGLAAINILGAANIRLYIASENGGTTDPGTGAHYYYAGARVVINAIAEDGYEFCGWSGDVPAGQENVNPLIIELNLDTSIIALFCRKLLCVLEPEGTKILNRSLSQAEYINVLTWEGNPENVDIALYRIYQIENGSSTMIAEVNAGIFTYVHRNILQNKEYTYEIVVVNSEGKEGCRATVIVQ
jgi:hypothetical protein